MRQYLIDHLILFLAILLFPVATYSSNNPYFRFWTAEDGFDETLTVYVNI